MAKYIFDTLKFITDQTTNIIVGTETILNTINQVVENGKYIFAINSTWDYDNTSGRFSANFEYSIDGGANWISFAVEERDRNNNGVISYEHSVDVTNENIHFILRASKTTGTAELSFLKSEISVQKVA